MESARYRNGLVFFLLCSVANNIDFWNRNFNCMELKMTPSNETDKDLQAKAVEHAKKHSNEAVLTRGANSLVYSVAELSFKAGAAYGEARAWKSILTWLRPLNSKNDHLSGESIASVLEAELKSKGIL
jgi:hypothetical protein